MEDRIEYVKRQERSPEGQKNEQTYGVMGWET